MAATTRGAEAPRLAKRTVEVAVSSDQTMTRNLALPVGNLSSPLFGESVALVSGGGGNSASGNRRIELQIKLAF